MPEPEVPMPPGQPSRAALRLAGTIVEELFKNAEGKKADRLVMVSPDGEDLGRWSKGAARSFVAQIIDRARGLPPG
jgi:hypothetical protein